MPKVESKFQPDELVRITRGPGRGYEGSVIRQRENGTVEIRTFGTGGSVYTAPPRDLERKERFIVESYYQEGRTWKHLATSGPYDRRGAENRKKELTEKGYKADLFPWSPRGSEVQQGNPKHGRNVEVFRSFDDPSSRNAEAALKRAGIRYELTQSREGSSGQFGMVEFYVSPADQVEAHRIIDREVNFA